ncbi:hypothetical protein ACRAWF_00705 [Streptomyces sp. L7]
MLALALSDTSSWVTMLTDLLAGSFMALGLSWILFWIVQVSEPLSYGGRTPPDPQVSGAGWLRGGQDQARNVAGRHRHGNGGRLCTGPGHPGPAGVHRGRTRPPGPWPGYRWSSTPRCGVSASSTRFVGSLPLAVQGDENGVRRAVRPHVRKTPDPQAVEDEAHLAQPAGGHPDPPGHQWWSGRPQLLADTGPVLTTGATDPRRDGGLRSPVPARLPPLYNTFRRHRTLARAIAQGSPGGPAFFTALFDLHNADEARDYVGRVRTVPRGDPLDLDRQTLRRCIALLQDVSPAEPSPGISPEALAQLTKWRDDSQLLDELGRLDEQLRTR